MTVSQLLDFQVEPKTKPTINQALAAHIRQLKPRTQAQIRWFQTLSRVAFNYPSTKNVDVRVKRKRGRGKPG